MPKSKPNKDKELDQDAPNFKSLGLSRSELHHANKRFIQYKEHYHIDSYSDLHMLSELVFREIISERCKAKIGEIDKSKNVKEQKVIPVAVMRALDDNLNLMLVIREKLGLFTKEEKSDPYEHLTQLEKKFEKHREENSGDYSCPCPLCKEMIFFKFKVKDYDTSKHPFYKGKFLSNDELWKLYKEGILTKENLSKIYQTSTDYIDWLETHLYNKD